MVTGADGLETPLVPGGEDRMVPWDQLGKYIRRVKEVRASEMKKQCEVRTNNIVRSWLFAYLLRILYAPQAIAKGVASQVPQVRK